MVTATTAGVHWLATNRFQISSYSVNWSPPSPICFARAGVIVTSVGRIASCASWALLPEAYTFGRAGRYCAPRLGFVPMKSRTALSASLETRVLSVRMYVMSAVWPIPCSSTPS